MPIIPTTERTVGKARRGNRKPIQTRALAARPSILFFLFLVFYLMRLLQVGIRVPLLGEFRAEFLIGILVSIPALALLITESRPIFPSSFKIGLAFTMLMLVMTPLSVAPWISWQVFSNFVFKDFLVGICIAALITSASRLRWFLFSHLLGFAKMAEEGVVGRITGGLIWENQGTLRLHGATPRYDHPNSFGGTQAGTLPFIASITRIDQRAFLMLALAIQFYAAVDVIIHTGSRTTYFAMIVWILYAIAISRHKFKALIIAGLAVGLLSFVTPQQYVERFSQIFSQKDKEGGSVETRKEIYSDAISIFLSHPFGVGVGAFPSIRKETFGRTQDTHSLYLEVATNLGVQGLVIFFVLVLAMFQDLSSIQASTKKSLKALQYEKSTDNSARQRITIDLGYVAATAAALKGFLVIRLACGIFGHDLYEPYWWFTVGLIFSLTRLSGSLSTAVERHLDESVGRNEASGKPVR